MRSGWLLGAVLLLAGCTRTGLMSGDAEVAPGRVAELEERVLELQRRAAVTEVELSALRAKVAALEGTHRPAAGQPTPAPPRPAPEVQQPPERPPLPTARPLLPERIEEADLADPPVPVVAPPGSSLAVSPAAQGLYDRGYALFHQGRYAEAEAAFGEFLAGFANTDLGDNAQFWIGESRFQRGDLRGALVAYRDTVARFPQGNKLPDALLKQGQCLETLGDANAARVVYDQLEQRFPDSAAAAVAQERRSPPR